MHIHCQIQIPCSIAKVLSVFQDRSQHHLWHQALQGFQLLNGKDWEVGTQHPFPNGKNKIYTFGNHHSQRPASLN